MPETENPFADVLEPPVADKPGPPRCSRNRGPGSVTIAGHFSQAVHRQLRMLGAIQGRTVQSLLGEALSDLFRMGSFLSCGSKSGLRLQCPGGVVHARERLADCPP